MFGLDAYNASRPLSEDGWIGKPSQGVTQPPEPLGLIPDEAESPFAGKGELLEADDATVCKTVGALGRFQDPLAKNRLAMDRHWTAIKAGYQFSALTKQDNQDIYTQSYPPGWANSLRTGAVPNKQADLCNKLVETLLVDPPRLDVEATVDDEAAKRGAELAREFLAQDATEAGMDDITLFTQQLAAATTRSSAFNHYWVDPFGGGQMPKQVKAHPLATDPANPLDAVDPMTGLPIPTTDYVLRYVTAEGQFTDNPIEAERVWLPKIRVDRMYREHVRLFPETADLSDAGKVVCLWYDTVDGCRHRFPEAFADVDESDLTALTAWEPVRPSVLLPPAMRSRWRNARGATDTGVVYTGDERLVFFYLLYIAACPEYPEGAAIAVNGARGGWVLSRDTLSAVVEVPSGRVQDQVVEDIRPMDIPMAQVRLLVDDTDGDPMGKAFMARIGAPGEAGATIASAFMEALDITLHPARFTPATSPVRAEDVESSRATGDFVQVMSKEDYPFYEAPRDLPGATFNVLEWLYGQMDSAAGLNKPAQGADDSKEVSGVARRIAVEQSLVSLSTMQHAEHVAWMRHGRVKLQLAMKHFRAPQLLRIVGTDGAAKQEWFTGNDFATCGSVTITTGTGTLLPPSERVNYALQLRDVGLMDNDEAFDVARPAFAKTLGAPENPHVQRIERQVSSWLEGPPEGWEAEAMAYQQAVVQHAQVAQAELATLGAVQTPPPNAPWTPFATEPVDEEPAVAAIRKRRLGTLMAQVEFSSQPEPWRQVVRDAFMQAKQFAQPPMPQQMGGQVAVQGQPPMVA